MEKDKLQKDEGACTDDSKGELKEEELDAVAGALAEPTMRIRTTHLSRDTIAL